jgi:hypothetical protein
MVPEEGEPPATPSTDQTTLLKFAVNCWVRVYVNEVTRGLTDRLVLAVAMFEYGLRFPAVSAARTR